MHGGLHGTRPAAVRPARDYRVTGSVAGAAAGHGLPAAVELRGAGAGGLLFLGRGSGASLRAENGRGACLPLAAAAGGSEINWIGWRARQDENDTRWWAGR